VRYLRLRRTEFWLGLWTLLFVGATATLVILQPFSRTHRMNGEIFALRATGQAGRMHVDWDPRSQSIRSADRATLDVEDGGSRNSYPVEPKILRAGGLDYLRKSKDLLLKVTLHQKGKPETTAFVRSIGPLNPAVSPSQSQTQRPDQVRSRRRR
jgi:hypothetical protein